MLLTVQEMEVLCVFYTDTVSATLDALRDAETRGGGPHDRTEDIKRLIEKLSHLNDGEAVCLAFRTAPSFFA
jgi:hypothetical protein